MSIDHPRPTSRSHALRQFRPGEPPPRKDLWLPIVVGIAAAVFSASWSTVWQIQVSMWLLLIVGSVAWALGHLGSGGSFGNPFNAPGPIRRELVYLVVGAIAAVELLAILWLLAPRPLVPIAAFLFFSIGVVVHQYRYSEALRRLPPRQDAKALPAGETRPGQPESTRRERRELPDSTGA